MNGTICIFGTGRTGSTIFFNVLATHPDLGWVSNLVEKMPSRPELSLLSRLHPLALKLDSKSPLKRFLPRPAESLRTINEWSNGLLPVPRELAENEIPAEAVQRVRDYHARVLRYQGRQRLVIKRTGFPRFSFWRNVFPDARFIHVLRDGRAVAYSMMRVRWWDGTLDSWWWGPMPDAYKLEYENSGRRPAVLAAIVWKHLLDIYESEMSGQRDLTVTTVRHNDFTSNPVSEMRKVTEFCGLTFPREFENSIGKFPIHDSDLAWRRGLDRKDLADIERVLGDHLAKYGFA